MLTNRSHTLPLLAAATFLAASCSTVSRQSEPTVLPSITNPVYLLGPGDRLMIKLYGDDSFDGEYVVSPEGGVALPLVGVLPTAGLSLPEFEQVVERKLSNGFYHNPALTMEITRFRPFYIIGEVQRPGQYAFVPGLTLKKAVAIAGGYTYRANRKRFDVQRENLDRVVRVSTEPDVKIGPGDTVTILERFF